MDFQCYRSYDGLYARQQMNEFPDMEGEVSGDGRILSVSGDIGGYQESFAVLDSHILPEGCHAICDPSHFADWALC